MATKVKSVYENGIFKPAEESSLGIAATAGINAEELEKELIEGYTEMAAESRKEAEEWLVTERELEEAL